MYIPFPYIDSPYLFCTLKIHQLPVNLGHSALPRRGEYFQAVFVALSHIRINLCYQTLEERLGLNGFVQRSSFYRLRQMFSTFKHVLQIHEAHSYLEYTAQGLLYGYPYYNRNIYFLPSHHFANALNTVNMPPFMIFSLL